MIPARSADPSAPSSLDRGLFFRLVLLASWWALGACALDLRPEGSLADGGVTVAPGVGASCTSDSGCRAGLACAADRTCQPPGTRPAGQGCTLSAECLPDHQCGLDGFCAPNGAAPEGGRCQIEADCAAGLLCALHGLSGTCVKIGKGDVGAACQQPSDCLGGLVCSLGKCQSFASIELWKGVRCPKEDLPAPRVHFRVPRVGERSDDFYRLPFPNDIRKKNGKVSLEGHPRPGARYLPFDPVERYFQAVEEDVEGFGLNQGVYFRLSHEPDPSSLARADATVFVNITPGSPEYNQSRRPETRALSPKSFYICPHGLVVRHGFGAPLRPGETYAVLIRSGLVDARGMRFEADDDFRALLAAQAPAASELAAAWSAYTPLRAWIAERGMDPSGITAAAVFTTQKAEDALVGLRRAVREAPAPTVKNLVRCGDPGVRSPCEDGKTGADHQRGCFPADPAAPYDELQGTVTIPVFQMGETPYEAPAQGGAIGFDGTGRALFVRTEDVCFSLAVPKGAAPAGGWPVVVYAHGTGGTYRSAVEIGLAGEYASGQSLGGPGTPMATFGYEGALHGTRRGGSDRSPDELVFNFLNPRAARDNALQAAADLFVVARALEGGSLGTVAIDPARIALYGHSQGGNATALAFGHEPGFGAAVLSGTGGTLIYSFLEKSQPVDIAAGLPFLLGDPEVDENHPVLNIMQMYFERSDPVNLGRRLYLQPPAGVPPRHVFHVFGTGDTYSPVETQRTFAQAASLPVVPPILDEYGLARTSAPVRANVIAGAGTAVTVLQAQYAPAGYDGHFVSTRNDSARRAIRQMLQTFAREGVPTVSP